jgi:succinate dehydrogenase / fumarate reductase, cytochrome b subunit
MTWKEMFTSSIGKKLVMAFTGLFLISFLLIHVSINACVFAPLFLKEDGGNMFNKAAHFMGSTVLIRIMEVGLFLGFILHIVQGLMLEVQNKAKRNTKYAVNAANQNSKWYTRSMGTMGILVLAFLILHLFHFWTKARFLGGIPDVDIDGKTMHNMYALMDAVFKEVWVVIVYFLGCVALAWHLIHGFQSSFRTIGVSSQKYLDIAKTSGIGFSVLVCLLFALMPIAFYFDWIPAVG